MITDADNAKSGGCFGGVLRRLLCSGSPQTHPSDQITETEIPRTDKEANNNGSQAEALSASASASAPSIVARLMGLDSLPETNWVPNVKTPPDSVPRSRSVNFMDYLLEFDLKDLQHRRVKTSVSFREVSRPLLHENKQDNFLLVYLDKMDGTKEIGSGLGKSELGFQQLKLQQRVDKNKNKNKEISKKDRKAVFNNKKNQRTDIAKVSTKFKDEPRRVRNKSDPKAGKTPVSAFVPKRNKDFNRKSGANSMEKSPAVNHKEELVEREFTKRRIRNQLKIKEVDPSEECDSENSSPVSVLDHDEFSVHEKTSLPEDSESTRSNSIRNSGRTITNYKYPPSHVINGVFSTELKTTERKDEQMLMDHNQETEYHRELVSIIFRLTEKDIKESTWIATSEFKLEEMCTEFGQEILDRILQQLVDELVGFDMEISACNACINSVKV